MQQDDSRVALVVGVGASAGGLEPLQQLLQHVPATQGLTFVVVQHLDPRHPSMLVELLVRRTALAVGEAVDGVRLEPEHVYVIAPGTLLTIEQGVLHVTASQQAPSLPIDEFLQSLAEDQGGACGWSFAVGSRSRRHRRTARDQGAWRTDNGAGPGDRTTR